MSSNDASDATVAAEMLEQLPSNEVVLNLTGDGAYDTQLVYEAAIQRGTIPIVPPRKNARIRKGDAFAYRHAAIAACRYLGRKYRKYEVVISAAVWLKPR